MNELNELPLIATVREYRCKIELAIELNRLDRVRRELYNRRAKLLGNIHGAVMGYSHVTGKWKG